MATALDAALPSDRSRVRRLAIGYLLLAGVTYVLIVFGALVRAHGAGLACPDWPLCFGEVIPEMDFKVAFEWGHRALAGSVGIVFAVLAALTLRQPALRAAMGLGVAIAAALLATQIVLGGLTVLELLASWTVTSHLVTGNAFALALVLLGRRLLGLAAPESRPGSGATPAQRAGSALAAAMVVLQIVLGGLVSSNYAGLVCPDWPTCMNGEYFPTFRGIQGLHVLHRTVGYLAVLAIVAAAALAWSRPAPRRWLGTAAGLALLQIGVGVANVLLRVPVEVTALHSALAAGIVCTVGVGVIETWRRPTAAV